MVFAAPSQFQFLTTSPKDDLISLCYLLVYLYNGYDSPFMSNEKSSRQVFNSIRDTKLKLTVEELCGPQNSECWQLHDFISAVFKLEFGKEIDYGGLKAKLMTKCKALQFEWSSAVHARSPEAHCLSEGDSPDAYSMKPKRSGMLRECEGSNESDLQTMVTTARSKVSNMRLSF